MDLLKMILKANRKPRPKDSKRVLIARKEPTPKAEGQRIAPPEKIPLPEYYKMVIEAHKSTKFLFNF
jgi:hypothetical protein